MVLRHFLFLSSVTPTRNVDLGPGIDSPAELLCGPCGTPRAGSCLLSFCIGVCGDFSIGEAEWFGLKACLALEKISFALATLLPLRFFSVGVTRTSAGLRSGLVRSATDGSMLCV